MAEKEEHNYIFPKGIAHAFKNIDQRTQYESTILSMTLILIGMILFTIYMDFYTGQTLWFKIMFTFNSVCGMALLGSFLITQFQAYQAYMEVMDEMKNFGKSTTSLEATQQEINTI